MNARKGIVCTSSPYAGHHGAPETVLVDGFHFAVSRPLPDAIRHAGTDPARRVVITSIVDWPIIEASDPAAAASLIRSGCRGLLITKEK